MADFSALDDYNNDPFGALDSYESKPSVNPGNFVTDTIQDIGKGALKLPGTLTGLADIPAGLAGMDRPFSRAADALGELTGFQPSQLAEQTQYSPERQQSMLNTREAWDAFNRGESSLPKAIGTTLANPRAVVGNIAESLPSMVAGGLGARALLGPKALAPAVGEGAVMAGLQMQNTDPSIDPQKAAALSLATGVAGGALGYGGGKLAERMGLIDPDTLIARGLTPEAANAARPGLLKGIGLGAVQEGLLEELPQSLIEQGSQNLAEDRPFTEGMAEAGVQGTLAGGIMGGGFNAAAGPLSRAATKAAIDANPTADADTIINQAREIANAADVNAQGAAANGSPDEVRAGAPASGAVDAGDNPEVANQRQINQELNKAITAKVTDKTILNRIRAGETFEQAIEGVKNEQQRAIDTTALNQYGQEQANRPVPESATQQGSIDAQILQTQQDSQRAQGETSLREGDQGIPGTESGISPESRSANSRIDGASNQPQGGIDAKVPTDTGIDERPLDDATKESITPVQGENGIQAAQPPLADNLTTNQESVTDERENANEETRLSPNQKGPLLNATDYDHLSSDGVPMRKEDDGSFTDINGDNYEDDGYIRQAKPDEILPVIDAINAQRSQANDQEAIAGTSRTTPAGERGTPGDLAGGRVGPVGDGIAADGRGVLSAESGAERQAVSDTDVRNDELTTDSQKRLDTVKQFFTDKKQQGFDGKIAAQRFIENVSSDRASPYHKNIPLLKADLKENGYGETGNLPEFFNKVTNESTPTNNPTPSAQSPAQNANTPSAQPVIPPAQEKLARAVAKSISLSDNELADHYKTDASRIEQSLFNKGKLNDLVKQSGAKNYDAFEGLPISDRAKAYAKFVKAGNEHVTFDEGYNDSVRREEQEAQSRRKLPIDQKQFATIAKPARDYIDKTAKGLAPTKRETDSYNNIKANGKGDLPQLLAQYEAQQNSIQSQPAKNEAPQKETAAPEIANELISTESEKGDNDGLPTSANNTAHRTSNVQTGVSEYAETELPGRISAINGKGNAEQGERFSVPPKSNSGVSGRTAQEGNGNSKENRASPIVNSGDRKRESGQYQVLQSSPILSKTKAQYLLDQNDSLRSSFDLPSEQVRNVLKREAFKWSPSNNAWQRQNTLNGIAAAKRVLDGLYDEPAKLSQSQSTTGSTVADLTAKLDATDKNLLQSGKLNIVQQASDVPDSAVSIDASGIEGFYLKGKVYVVADNVTPSTLRSVLAHEYLHASLAENKALRDRILGAQSELRDIFAQVESGKYTGRYKTLYDEALRRDIFAQVESGKYTGLYDEALRRDIFAQVESGKYTGLYDEALRRDIFAQTSEADRFEEFLSYSVSSWHKAPQSLPERLAKAIANLVSTIKAAIFRYSGVPVGRLSPADLSALSKSAMNTSEIPNNSISPNTGNISPNSDNSQQGSDIRYSIADDVRESAEKLTANLAEHLSTNKTFNWWHKTVGTQFHKALVDKHFGKVFNRSMQFEQDMARLANEAADLAPSLLPKLDALSDVGKELTEFAKGAIKGQAGRRMIDSRKIGEAVFQTTLDDKPMTEKELTDAGYTEPQRKMYHEFFAAVNQSLDDLAKSEMFRMARALKIGQAPNSLSLKDTANWYAEQAEDANQGKDFIDKAAQVAKLKKEGYAPLMRFGQYTLDVVTPKPDGSEKREFFGMFETEQEAKEMEKAMRSEYPDANIERGIMSQNDWQMFKGVTPETMEVFAKMMNVEQDEAFQAYLKSAVTNRSAMKRLIHRKKMPGFAKDTQRILASFLTSNARAASKNYHLGELVDAIAAIPKTKGDVIDESVELYNYVQNPSAKGAAIRGLMFAWYLGGSVSSAAVNLTQSFTTTLPYLHQFGETKQVARLMGQAMKLAANHNAITGDIGKALQRADKEGITEPHELHMLYGESMRTGMLSNQFLRPLSKVWGSFFSLAESYNRRVSFIAAYNLAKETSQSDPFQFAVNAVNETQFVYSKSSRPNWARSTVGSTVFTFKTFTLSYLEFLKRLPAKERALALGVLVLFAGLSGAPGADDLDDLIDTAGQAMGYNTNSKAWKDRVLSDFIGNEAAQYALYGLSHGLPIDVSSRLSVGNIVPGSALFKKSEIDKSRDVMEFAGPAGSLSKRIVDAFEAAGSRDSFTGQASAVGRAVIPKAMSDLAQAIDMQITGQYRDTRGRKVADADLSDALSKALGFQPTSVAEPRRAERYLNQSVTMAKTVEADIAGLWAGGIVEKNRGKVDEAKSMLKDWNEKNPETPIRVDLKQIQRRVKQMRMTSGERLLKSTPKEIRRYAREALND
jgi:hypothetical protein